MGWQNIPEASGDVVQSGQSKRYTNWDIEKNLPTVTSDWTITGVRMFGWDNRGGIASIHATGSGNGGGYYLGNSGMQNQIPTWMGGTNPCANCFGIQSSFIPLANFAPLMSVNPKAIMNRSFATVPSMRSVFGNQRGASVSYLNIDPTEEMNISWISVRARGDVAFGTVIAGRLRPTVGPSIWQRIWYGGYARR